MDPVIHVIFWYFDDILGQQVLAISPELEPNVKKPILNILSRLVDIYYDVEEWIFMYADSIFASQNIKFSSFNSSSRGGLTDFVISVVAIPPTDRVKQVFMQIDNYMQAIMDVCKPYLFEFRPTELDSIKKLLEGDMWVIINEISQLFLDEIE